MQSKLKFSKLAKLLGKKNRKRLRLISTLRVLANVLDLIGIAGVALLAMAFGAFTTERDEAITLNIPIFGEMIISESEAVLIAMGVAVVFVSKSIFSILLNLRSALFVAEIESHMSKNLAEIFFEIRENQGETLSSVSDFQSLAIKSTKGIKDYLNARILFLAEGSLLVSMVVLFLIVSPIAAITITVFVGVVLVSLNLLINRSLAKFGQRQIEGSNTVLQSSRDLNAIKREAATSGVMSEWIAKFGEGRQKISRSDAVIYSLNSLPRFVIETSLILGIFLFLAGVVVFSDIPSQSVTIGVFFAGGLRIMAAIIPFQGAITGMRSGEATGRFAFEVLERGVDRTLQDPCQKCGESEVSLPLKFENVSFAYHLGSKAVLQDVSFEVDPHTQVAIVGPSGAGKSTIFDLAMGFLTPSEGKVQMGEVSTQDILSRHPATFSIVPQKPQLISGTILENVSLMSVEKTNPQRVRELLIRFGLQHLTEKESWEKLQLHPDSGLLSGGEIQRLSLARALYRNPKILFLDEATSALDAETEYKISKALEELKKEMSVVLIAHRLSTVRRSDKILYLDRGHVVAEGTFEELKKEVPDFSRAIQIMQLND